jgi:uracil-DNA glycosylase
MDTRGQYPAHDDWTGTEHGPAWQPNGGGMLIAMARPRRDPQGVTMPPGRRIPRAPDPRPERAGDAAPIGDAALEKAGAELASLIGQVRACTACGRASPRRAFGSGFPRAPVMLLKERPSEQDIAAETAFTAEVDALQRAFDRLGIPLGWVYGSTAVRCGTRTAADGELYACAIHLLVEVEAVGPRVLVAFGDRAVRAVRSLDGRCGIVVPEDLPRGRSIALRPGLALLVTEELPEGVRDADAKKRLWRELQQLPAMLGEDFKIPRRN